MIQGYALEVLIVGIVLIALYIVSKKVDNGLKFLKKDMDYLENDIENMLKYIHKKEPSFKDKVKKEEKRLHDIKFPKNWGKMKEPKKTVKKSK